MKLKIKYLIVFLIISVLSSAQEYSKNTYHDNIIIVKLKNEFKQETQTGLKLLSLFINDNSKSGDFIVEREFPSVENIDMEIIKSKRKTKYQDIGTIPDLSLIYRIKFNENQNIWSIIDLLNSLEDVEYAEPLYKLELLYTPNDPMNQTDQYWLNMIKAYEAWDVHQGDTNIVIGISDTGIDLSHPDLIYNIKYNYNDIPDGIDNDNDGYIDNFRGWNFGDDNNDVQADINAHGTWVCGIAGASTDNGIGVSGAGFKSKILPLKIMNSNGVIVNAYQSIVYAAQQGCDVINCSWGSSYYQQMAQDVANYATYVHDLLIVGAAGNTNSEIKFYPASYENVLSVAATTASDEKWTPNNTATSQGSSYSHYVDVSAPGTMFKSTGNGGGYTLMWGGTSFAAPIVSGCAAILRSYYPDYNASQIKEILKISADNIDTIPHNVPYANKMGKGRVNLYKALTMELTPAIVFNQYNITNETNRLIISGQFTNYLADANNLTISISVPSFYSQVANENIFQGSLAELESFVSNNMIINLSEFIPYDYKLEITFNYLANNYSSSQTIEFIVNPSYKDLETDILSLSACPDGRLGYSDINSSIGNGFTINNTFKLFYDCGIISGTSASEIFSSVRQSSDFKTLSYPAYIDSELSDYHVTVEICDSNDVNPKGIRIVQDIYSWYGAEHANYIISDYRIINESQYNINDFYFGLFTDWDLVNAADNQALMYSPENFMYCSSNQNMSMYAGIKLLTSQPVNNYAAPLSAGGDGVIDLSDGFGDIEKYHIMSNSNLGYTGVPADIVIFTGAGPFNIAAGDTVVVGFSLIAAESYYDMIQAVLQSKQTYFDTIYPQNINNFTEMRYFIYPNPIQDFLMLSVANNKSETYAIEIYDNLGRLLLKEVCSDNCKVDLRFLPAGLYNLLIHIDGEIFSNKLVKSN